jgi:hypothetical protein
MKIHQQKQPSLQQNEKDPGFSTWEGWNRLEIEKAKAGVLGVLHSEHGNVFVLARRGLGLQLSPTFLIVTSLSLICIFTFLFYFVHRQSGFNIYNTAILGFCLYMISDLFSPIYRFEYYTVQWFFPILLAASGYVKTYKWIYIAIAAGLIFNIINSPFIKWSIQ